jgi:4-azaleucine resistance transporter AzlC
MSAPSEVVFTRAGVLRGARRSVPLLAALGPFGAVAGTLAQAHGLSWLEALLMSALVFAGAGQVLALSYWAHPAAAVFACLVVNLRMVLMGPSLASWLDKLRGWRLWGSLFVMADHSWALSITEARSGGTDAGFLFGSGALMWAAWVCGSMIGFALGGMVHPAAGHPLFFIALAVFVALLVPLWRGRRDALPWLAAAIVGIGVQRLLPHGAWYIVAGALAGSLVGVLRDRHS